MATRKKRYSYPEKPHELDPLAKHKAVELSLRARLYEYIVDTPGQNLKDVAYRFRKSQKVIDQIVNTHELLSYLPVAKKTPKGQYILVAEVIDDPEIMFATTKEELEDILKPAGPDGDNVLTSKELEKLILNMNKMLKDEGLID